VTAGRPGAILLCMEYANTDRPQFDNSIDGARAWFAHNGMTRPRDGRLIGGVTAGLARRYGINTLVARVAMVLGVVIATPLIYVPLWILMPKDAA
jgi:phage shock protein PspC (stress-responsive transcriptional regulator)